jgi:hypothetical protein
LAESEERSFIFLDTSDTRLLNRTIGSLINTRCGEDIISIYPLLTSKLSILLSNFSGTLLSLFQINSEESFSQDNPNVATLNNGSFVVVYATSDQA